jgi:hypothetical protein
MKKIFYLLFVFPLLFSCGDNSSDDATPSAKAQAQEPKELGYKMYIEINDYDSFKDASFLSEMCEKNNISTIDDFIKIYGYPNEVYADEYTMEFSWHGLIKTNIKHFSFRNVNSGEYKEAWMNEMKGSRYVYTDVRFIAFSFGTNHNDWGITSGDDTIQNNREIVKDKNNIKGYSEDLF